MMGELVEVVLVAAVGNSTAAYATVEAGLERTVVE